MSNRKILNAAATGGIGYYPVGNPTDAYYDNVSLLLNGDVEVDSNFANVSLLLDGNTLTDKSNNKATITNTGSVTVSSAVKKFGTGSLLFNNTASAGQYLQQTSSSITAFGTNDFTIDLWVYPTAISSSHINTIFDSSAASGPTLHLSTDGRLNFVGNATDYMYSTAYLSINIWYHVAVVKSSGIIKIYINGTLTSTYSTATTFTGPYTFTVGSQPGYGRWFQGYIDDLRITKGVARYTSNFTPPVKALPTHEILDSSVYRLPVTAVGNARIDTATKKFGTGAMYFDGNGDYLTLPANPALNIGAGDFTIELWCWYAGASWPSNNDLLGTGGYYTAGKNGNWAFSVRNSTQIMFVIYNAQSDTTGGVYDFTVPTITVQAWHHIAVTRLNGLVNIWVDGVKSVTSLTNNTAMIDGEASGLKVGGYIYPASPNYFNGYIDDIRITKGIARYTANFPPGPTASLPTIPPTIAADPWWGNVSLLLDGNTTDAYDPYWQNVSLMLTGDDFIDWSNQHNAVTNNGTVTLSTATKKFNASSLSFSGSNYLIIPNNSALQLGSGDFTVEFWVRATALGAALANQQIIFGGGPSNISISLYNGNVQIAQSWVVGLGSFADTNIQNNVWNHIAIVRSGTTIKCYVNGVQNATTITNSTNFSSSSTAYIGSNDNSPGYYFSGQIADLRITKGIARTITVPTAALPSYKIQDRTQNNLTVTPYGNVQLSTDVMKNGTGSMFFDGSGDYVNLSPSSNLNFGTGDFTVEGWVYPTLSAKPWFLISSVSNGGLFFGGNDANGYLGVGRVMTAWDYTTTTAVTLNIWSHIALVRSGTLMVIYLNGVSIGSTTNSINYDVATGGATVGLGSNYYFQGYIDDFRITKGYARYTQNFTPPSQSFATQYISTGYDANYADVSLLLNGNGTNGSQVFTDLSSNTKAFTNNGVTVNTTTKKYGTGSLSFNGSSNYILVGTNDASFNFGSGDFTIETWFNVPTLPNTYTRIITNFDGVVADPLTHEGPQIEISNTNKLTCRFGFADGTFTDLAGATTITANIWNHVALVRQGTTLKMYLNGVSDGSITVSQAQYWNSNIKTIIGAWYVNGSYSRFFNGYLDDFRITKGIARYTTNFTPPTYQLPTDTTGTVIDPLRASTSLLLRGNGTNGSTSFTDESPNGLTVTNNGSVTVNTTTKKYGTGSMAFSGSNYLSLPTSSPYFTFGTEDYTVECWVMFTDTATAEQNIFSENITSGNLTTGRSSGKFFIGCRGTAIDVAGTTTIVANTWYHYAASRSNGTTRLFINGVLEGSSTTSRNYGATNAYVISGIPYISTAYGFPGYLDDLRITKGYARYTANFTPPTYEDPIVTGTVYDYNYPQVSLLLNGDGTNGSTVFKDLSSSPKTITNTGSVAVNTTTKKFGTGSIAFSGSNSLAITSPSNLSFGTNDFTVEFWFYANSSSSYDTFFSTTLSYSGSSDLRVNTNSSARTIQLATNNSLLFAGNTAFTLNVWNHLAIARYGTNLVLFLNGVNVGSVTNSTNFVSDTFLIGSVSSSYYFNGYIDDLRITKGLARYTQNFTPPTASLPTSYS